MTAGTDLVVGTPDEIANLPLDQRGELITHALVESKQWLAIATKGSNPTPVAEFKAWAATVAEMTRQKGLAKDIQLDAQEMVRRAERGIGQTIRNGQADGSVRRPNETARRPIQSSSSDGEPDDRLSPRQFLRAGDESAETYDLTDDVSDEQFEEALTEARDEGNVSRANVIRKVRGETNQKQTREYRSRQIRDLAEQNYTSRQIADQLKIGTDWVTNIAREYGVDIAADRIVGKTRLINPERVLSETITTLEGLCMGVALLSPDDYANLDPEQVEQWSSSLTDSVKALNTLRKELDRVRR